VACSGLAQHLSVVQFCQKEARHNKHNSFVVDASHRPNRDDSRSGLGFVCAFQADGFITGDGVSLFLLMTILIVLASG